MKSNVSIVIITKNRKKSLKKCIKSIKNQNFKGDKEIIIVDSSDKPLRIKGVKCIYDKSLGIASARNVGVKNSKYNLIYFVDDDCVCDKNCLQELVNSIGGNAGVGGSVLSTKTNLIGETVSYIGYPAGGIRWYNKYKGEKVKVNHLSTCNCLYKKKILLEVNGFDDKLIYGTEDNDLSKKIIARKHPLIYNPSAIVYHEPRKSIISIFKWFFRRGIARVYLRNTKDKLKILLFHPRSSFLKILFVLLMIFVFKLFGLIISYGIIFILFIKKLVDFKTPFKSKILFLAPIVLLTMFIAETLGSLYGFVKQK